MMDIRENVFKSFAKFGTVIMMDTFCFGGMSALCRSQRFSCQFEEGRCVIYVSVCSTEMTLYRFWKAIIIKRHHVCEDC